MWISIIILLISSHQGYFWTYRDSEIWGTLSDICDSGTNQSPIDLELEVAELNDERPNIQFYNYSSVTPTQITIKNDGHSVVLSSTWNGYQPNIMGPFALPTEVYLFHSFHLHWSYDDNDGTEHSIQRQRYAVELHLVHYNSKFENYNVAVNNSEGLAVVAILFQVNDFVAPNSGLQQFVSDIQSVINPGDSTKITTFDLSSLLPNPIGSFYSYRGSLTAPPCSENVRWIILSQTQPVTSEIVRRLRNIKLAAGELSNVRPLQAVNNRLVEFYEY